MNPAEEKLRSVVREELQVGLAGMGQQTNKFRTALMNKLTTESRWTRYSSYDSFVRRLTVEAQHMTEWYDAVESLREADGPADDAIVKLQTIVKEVATNWRREQGKLNMKKPKLAEEKLRSIIQKCLQETYELIPEFEYSSIMETFIELISEYMDTHGIVERYEIIKVPTNEKDTNVKINVVFKYNKRKMSFGGGIRNNELIFVRYK